MDGLLGQDAGICDSHFHHEGTRIELGQRRLLGLASEAADSPVRQPVHATADAVVVTVVRIGQRQNLLGGHGIQ